MTGIMTKRESQFLLLPLSGGVVDSAFRTEGWSREGGTFSVPDFRPLRKHFGEGAVRRTSNLRSAAPGAIGSTGCVRSSAWICHYRMNTPQ